MPGMLAAYRINGIEMMNEEAVDEDIIEAGMEEEEKEVEGKEEREVEGKVEKGEEEADSRPTRTQFS